MNAAPALAGMTREKCATACNADRCVIGGLPRCLHPCGSGLPNELLNDRGIHEAFDEACTVLGTRNIHKAGVTTL
jgi:hypothetical protein